MADAREFLEGLGRGAGTRLGTRFAVPFEVFPLRQGPSSDPSDPSDPLDPAEASEASVPSWCRRLRR